MPYSPQSDADETDGLIMSRTDSEANLEYPYPQRDFYGALVAAVRDMRTMKLVSADDHACRIVVKPVAGPPSFRRDIVLSISATSADSSRVHAEVPPRATRLFSGPFDAGQDRRNISAIHDATSTELSRHPPLHHEPLSANATRITDMESLLDRGFITQREFDKWSAEIRGGQ